MSETRFAPTPNDLQIRCSLSDLAELYEREGPFDLDLNDEDGVAIRAFALDADGVSEESHDSESQKMTNQLDAICRQLNESSAIDAALAVLPFYCDDPRGDPQPIGYYVVACPLRGNARAAGSFRVIHHVRVKSFADDCKGLRERVVRYASRASLNATPGRLSQRAGHSNAAEEGARDLAQNLTKKATGRSDARGAAATTAGPVDPWQWVVQALRAATVNAARLTRSMSARESLEAAA